MHLSKLRNKITLMRIKKTENENGFVFEHTENGPSVWASIEPILIKSIKNNGFFADNSFVNVFGVYKIAMRKNFIRNARHTYHNALRWNHKILTIIHSFQEDSSGRWVQAVAVDCGREAT
jgi:head-tail adaptor